MILQQLRRCQEQGGVAGRFQPASTSSLGFRKKGSEAQEVWVFRVVPGTGHVLTRAPHLSPQWQGHCDGAVSSWQGIWVIPQVGTERDQATEARPAGPNWPFEQAHPAPRPVFLGKVWYHQSPGAELLLQLWVG